MCVCVCIYICVCVCVCVCACSKFKLLYKKENVDELVSNYRPISLIQSFSKIFEKVIYQQTYTHFKINNLLYSIQYGFRSGHSTE